MQPGKLSVDLSWQSLILIGYGERDGLGSLTMIVRSGRTGLKVF